MLKLIDYSDNSLSIWYNGVYFGYGTYTANQNGARISKIVLIHEDWPELVYQCDLILRNLETNAWIENRIKAFISLNMNRRLKSSLELAKDELDSLINQLDQVSMMKPMLDKLTAVRTLLDSVEDENA